MALLNETGRRLADGLGLSVARAWLLALSPMLVAASGVSAAPDPIFDKKGFSPNREMASELGFEHVDPLTGNLLLTFTDLVLPGNGGFDLAIQRTYNSKIYDSYVSSGGGGGTYALGENSALGLGWTMHMGRLSNLNSINPGPVIEMPDGSAHASFRHMDNDTTHFMTRDLWTLDRFGQGTYPVLRLPNGVRYVFGHGNFTTGNLDVTDVYDTFGNSVHVSYLAAPDDRLVSSVEQRFASGAKRSVTFSYATAPAGGAPTKRLASFTSGNRTWTFTHEARGPLQGPNATVLIGVQPPAGPAWSFDYFNEAWPSGFLLKSVTTPHGGTLQYTYQAQVFYHGSAVAHSPAVSTRIAGGTDISGGTWTYGFTQGGLGWNSPVIATVSAPCRTTVYTTYAIGPMGNEMPWRIGSLASKVTSQGGTSETESYVWSESETISPDTPPGEAQPPRVPLLSSRTVTREGLSYTTTNAYHTGGYSGASHRNFNDYGRPATTTEAGQLSRTITRTFYPTTGGDTGFGSYIVDRTASESVSGTGGPYVRSYVYDMSNGFLTSATVYGIATTYTKAVGGNVATRKDASGHLTSYLWSWGVPSSVSTPVYTITRSINGDSTIAWQQQRGFKTSFTYDGLFRLTKSDHPVGDDTNTSYAADGRTVTVSRGTASTTSTLDGFGRVSFATNSLGIKSDVTYDSCGRKTYESYPYTTSNIGSTYQYDALDRLRFKTNPGGSSAQYAYGVSGTDQKVTITDEQSRLTDQVWKAFGDPGDARLASVLDAGSGSGGSRQTTSYSYNGIGGLTGVTPASGGARSWVYTAGTDRLASETQPESGQVIYGYYANGLVRTRSDQQFGTTTFSYDGNGRLTLVDRPGGHPDTRMAYDHSDNRTVLSHGNVSSELGPYDGNNRLAKRVDKVAGRTFTTTYGYDNGDRLLRINYPSGTLARYFYDNEGRVTKVTSDEAGAHAYADQFAYHPSGGVSSYRSGNGIVNTIGYDANRYWITQAASGGVISVLYDLHDLVGNVTRTVDSRLGTYTYGYDPVDRLTSATLQSGIGWGNGTFGYDPMGNRTSKTIAGAPTTYTYSSSSNRLTSAAGAEPVPSFGYDANGNTTSDVAGTAYAFNADNMMTSATVAGVQTTYAYDGDNLRKLKQQGSSTRYYVHGPGNQILSEFQKAGTGAAPVRDYVYAGSRLLASVRPPVLTTLPDELTFAVVRNTTGEPTKPVAIDTGGSPLPWTATVSNSWITLSATSGSTAPPNPPLNVGVNVTGLQVGIYTGTVTVTSSGALGSPRVVTVRLAVVPTSGLVAMPRPLRFVVQEGSPDVPAQNEYILRAGGAAVAWTATVSQSWIALSAASGTTPSTVEVTVNPAGLTRGTHYGWITVTAPGVTGSPQLVPVELVVTPGAGSACEAGAWYCEAFDGLENGPIDAQGGWVAQRVLTSQVESDPRGAGRALLVDPPSWSDGTLNDMRVVTDHAIDGTQISAQLMAQDAPSESPQVAKIEFFTVPNVAWGKSRRTYGALRFGNKLYLQFGPNIYKVLLDQMESGRWYDVKIVYQGGKIYAYVDGTQRFVTSNPLSGAFPTQAFVISGWAREGQAYVDLLDQRPLKAGLVVEPAPLRFSTLPASLTAAPAPKPLDREPKREAVERLGQLPLSFEPNLGQSDPAIRFTARGLSHGLIVKDDELVLTGRKADVASSVHVRFEGASGSPRIEGRQRLPGRVNYLIGKDPSGWRTGVPLYESVRYDGVYPDIDLVLYGSQGQLEYDFVVGPGGDPSRIRLSFDGAKSVRLDAASGDLVLETALGELRHRRPLVYQERDGRKETVAAEYVLSAEGQAAFKLAAYDPERPLVLDPVLVFSSYFGGDKFDKVEAVAVDSDESLYVAGNTWSASLGLVTPQPWLGVPQQTDVKNAAFVAKLNPSGSVLEYLTYISGQSVGPRVSALAVDSLGRAYMAGWISAGPPADGLPTVAPQGQPIQATNAGTEDGYIARLNVAGSQLEYATYLGGSNTDRPLGLAVDLSYQAYVVGSTASVNFPTVNPLPGNGAYLGNGDGFATWINAEGTAPLVRSTYLGGTSTDWATGVALRPVDVTTPTEERPTGIYVFGWTASANFPTSVGAWKPSLGSGNTNDYFVAALFDSPNANGFAYSTLLGGSSMERNGVYEGLIQQDRQGAMAVDRQGTAHVCGVTCSIDFPTTAQLDPGEQAPSGFCLGYSRSFCAGVAEGGALLRYRIGLGNFVPTAVAVDREGFVSVAGSAPIYPQAAARDFPLVAPVNPLQQRPAQPGYEARLWPVVAKLKPNGQLLFSTHLGALDVNDHGQGWVSTLAADETGGIYVGGFTNFTSFWTQEPVQYPPADTGTQPDITKPESGFVAKISTADATEVGATFEFSQAEYTTAEDGVPSSGDPNQRVALVTLKRGGDLTVAASVVLGTLDGTATAGLDYVTVSQRYDFAPGEEAKIVELPLIPDDLPESNTETVKLLLTRAIGGGLGGVSRADLVIEDDDGLVRTVKIRDRVNASGPNWTITEAIPWLTFAGLSGVGPSSVTATADATGLFPGTYTDYFIVTGDTGDSPQVVETTLKVLP